MTPGPVRIRELDQVLNDEFSRQLEGRSGRADQVFASARAAAFDALRSGISWSDWVALRDHDAKMVQRRSKSRGGPYKGRAGADLRRLFLAVNAGGRLPVVFSVNVDESVTVWIKGHRGFIQAAGHNVREALTCLSEMIGFAASDVAMSLGVDVGEIPPERMDASTG